MSKIIYFDYTKPFIKVKNKMISLPDYKGVFPNRLRYDADAKVLEVQCIECKKWYALAKLFEDIWVDIHDENAIYVTIYNEVETRCRNCDDKRPDDYIVEFLEKILGSKVTKN